MPRSGEPESYALILPRPEPLVALLLCAAAAGQDSLRWPRRLYSRLTYLARSVGQADTRPTDQQAAVWEMLSSRLAAQEDRFGATLAGPLAELNRTLADSGFPLVDTR